MTRIAFIGGAGDILGALFNRQAVVDQGGEISFFGRIIGRHEGRVHARAQQADDSKGPDGLAAARARGRVFERVFRVAVAHDLVQAVHRSKRPHRIVGHPW